MTAHFTLGGIMKRWMKPVAFAVVAMVGWACGASSVGNALVAAGTLLRDTGQARAQTTCTWEVKRGPAVTLSGKIEQGWEPFSTEGGSYLLRRCL